MKALRYPAKPLYRNELDPNATRFSNEDSEVEDCHTTKPIEIIRYVFFPKFYPRCHTGNSLGRHKGTTSRMNNNTILVPLPFASTKRNARNITTSLQKFLKTLTYIFLGNHPEDIYSFLLIIEHHDS